MWSGATPCGDLPFTQGVDLMSVSTKYQTCVFRGSGLGPASTDVRVRSSLDQRLGQRTEGQSAGGRAGGAVIPRSGAKANVGRRTILAATLVVALVPALGVPVLAQQPTPDPFVDYSAPGYNPANRDYIQFMKEQGITRGCFRLDDGSMQYCPGDSATRGQAAVFMVRGLYWALAGQSAIDAFAKEETIPYFPNDVPRTRDFFSHVQKARELMITSGTNMGEYGVDSPITWAQAATFAIRAWEVRETGRVTNSFSFAPYDGNCFQGYKDHPLFRYFRKAQEKNLMACSQNPDAAMTRGDYAKFVVELAMGKAYSSLRTDHLLAETNLVPGPSIKEHIYLGGRLIATETSTTGGSGGIPTIPVINPKFVISPFSVFEAVAGHQTAFAVPSAVTWSLATKPADQSTGFTYPDGGMGLQGSLYQTTATSTGYQAPSPISEPSQATNSSKVFSLAVQAVRTSDQAKNFATISLVKKPGVDPPWTTQNIGEVGVIGSAIHDTGGARSFIVQGAGDAIFFQQDEFRFVYSQFSGISVVEASVDQMDEIVNPNPGRGSATSKAGVMFRETDKPDSRNVLLAYHANGSPSNQGALVFQYRSATGGNTLWALYGNPTTLPVKLRLVRSGEWIRGYRFAGGSWQQVAEIQFSGAAFPDSSLAGLAVSSEYRGSATTARFSEAEARTGAPSANPSPDIPSLTMNGTPQAVQFNATVRGTTDVRVLWSVPGGVGSIDSVGRYTSPSAVSSPQQVAVVAARQADPSQSGTAYLTLLPAASPIAVTINPTIIALYPGQQQKFISNVPVTWSFVGTADGTLSSSGLYTAPASNFTAVPRTLAIRATSTQDPTRSCTASITLLPIAVSVSPTPIFLRPGDPAVTMAATIDGSSQGITWEWTAGPGTFVNNGLGLTYTPPASSSTDNTIIVTARSVQDPNRFGKASLTLGRDLQATVTVTPVNGQGYGPVTFNVSVAYAAQVTDVHQVINTSEWDPNFVSSEFNCWVWYNRASNRLFLWNPQVYNWVNPAGDAPGTGTSRVSRFCTLNPLTATRQDTGTGLTLTLPITFTNLAPGIVGTRRIWTSAAITMGLWTYQGYWNLF